MIFLKLLDHYNEQVQLIANDSGTELDTIVVDLIWPKNKVMLFLSENIDDYNAAQKSDWKCFCTADQFDVEQFIKEIEV